MKIHIFAAMKIVFFNHHIKLSEAIRQVIRTGTVKQSAIFAHSIQKTSQFTRDAMNYIE